MNGSLHDAAVRAELWAFSPFASAPLLAWGLAALIPIAIHLWSRRRYHEHAWAAMPFLWAALRRQARRLWFEQWVLLAVRVLVCLLLAVALADPVLKGLAALTPSTVDAVSTHHILVLDVSYSMGYRPGVQGERSAFDEARDALAQLVRRAPQGDGFSIVLLADAPRAAIGEPSFDRHAALDELQSLGVSHGGADVRATLAQVERLIVDARQRFPRLRRTRVVFATDLGRYGWENAVVAEMAPTWEKLADSAALEWIDVGRDDGGNVAIVSTRLSDSLAVVGRESRLEAEIRNFGASDARAVPVEFAVDGRPLGVRSLDIPAGGQAVAVADVRFETPGDRMVSVAIRGDRLALDNRRWLSVPVRDRARVLCVEGRLDEAAYLALALNPSPEDLSSVRVEVAAESALLDRSLSPYDLICLCNVGRLTAAESAALRGFVSPGGRLALFVGDQTQVDNFNAELGVGGADDERLRLLPARLGAPKTTGLRRIDPLDYRDPLAAPFRGQERAGLLSTPVWCYLSAELFDPRSAQVALAFDNGDPWIVRERRGRGEVWLVTSAASPRSQTSATQPPTPWSAWATWPSFPPMIQQLLRESLAGRLELRNVLVGQPLEGRFPGGVAGGDVVVIPPDEGETGETLPRRAAVQRVDDEIRWDFVATGSLGIYVARRGDQEERFAVNLDTRESDLTRLDPTLLPASLRRESPAGEELDKDSPSSSQARSLFRVVLAMVLGLLVGESLLASWLGRGDDRGPSRRMARGQWGGGFTGETAGNSTAMEGNGRRRG